MFRHLSATLTTDRPINHGLRTGSVSGFNLWYLVKVKRNTYKNGKTQTAPTEVSRWSTPPPTPPELVTFNVNMDTLVAARSITQALRATFAHNIATRSQFVRWGGKKWRSLILEVLSNPPLNYSSTNTSWLIKMSTRASAYLLWCAGRVAESETTRRYDGKNPKWSVSSFRDCPPPCATSLHAERCEIT